MGKKCRCLTSSLFVFLLVLHGSNALAGGSEGEEHKMMNVFLQYQNDKTYVQSHVLDKVRILEDDNIDVYHLALTLLSHESYSKYWDRSVWLLAAHLHKKDDLKLARHLLTFILRDEKEFNSSVINAKVEALNVLLQMVVPSTPSNPALLQFFNQDVKRSLYTGTGGNFEKTWSQRFHLQNLQREPTMTKEERDKIGFCHDMVRMHLYLTAHLFWLTHDKTYEKILNEGKQSTDQNRKTFFEHLGSDNFKSHWERGAFGLFVPWN